MLEIYKSTGSQNELNSSPSLHEHECSNSNIFLMDSQFFPIGYPIISLLWSKRWLSWALYFNCQLLVPRWNSD